MSAIRTHELTKRYGSFTALKGIDLEVGTGEVFGFLGPNGAGKSTTIRILLDEIRATLGTAHIFGLDSRRDAVAIHRRLGMIRQLQKVLYEERYIACELDLRIRERRATLRLIPGHNRLVFSIQKKHRKIYIGFSKGVDSSREIIKQCTGANINTQSHPRHTSTVTSYQLRQRFKHLRRNIINHIPALVLKYVSYGAAPRPRYTCNHQNLRFLLL